MGGSLATRAVIGMPIEVRPLWEAPGVSESR